MTIKKFNPEQFKLNQLTPNSTDLDLLAASVQVSLPILKKHERYIPAFPLSFLQQVMPARDALPVLLSALATMRMKNVSEIALGPALWSTIGNPSPRVRSRLLKQIAKLPESLCTLECRTGRPHLLRTGPTWPVKITNCR